MPESRTSRFFHALLGGGLPLVVGLLGLVALTVDLFGFFNLPEDYGDEVLLAAASVVLLAYFAQNRLQAAYSKRTDKLLGDVRAVLARVDDRLDRVRQVPPADIRGLLEANVQGANEYLFRGGSGRWLRSITMPALSKATDKDVQLTIELLDPRDEELCVAYADYRAKALPSGHLRDNEDARLIQRDILGSIYAAAWYSARRRMKADVILLRSFSPLRYDVSSEGLMITVAQMAEPGLYAASGTWLHAGVVDELRQASHGHATVTLPKLNGQSYPQTLEAVTADHVRDILAAALVSDSSAGSSLLTNFGDAAKINWEEIARNHVRR